MVSYFSNFIDFCNRPLAGIPPFRCLYSFRGPVYIHNNCLLLQTMADWARVLKRLPDDVVEYSVFPQIPDDLPNDDIKDFLEKQADAILAHLSDRIVNYIWQHESFSLRPVLSSTGLLQLIK